MKMKYTSALLLFTILTVSCEKKNEGTAKATAPLSDSRVIDVKKEAIIRLDDGDSCIITQNKKGGRQWMVGNIDGVLDMAQLEEGGKTRVGLKLISPTKAEYTVTEDDQVVYVDEDGDGVVDLKLDRKGKYRVKKIEWETVKTF